jgi:hypothetical protein
MGWGTKTSLKDGAVKALDPKMAEEIIGSWEDYDIPNEDFSYSAMEKLVRVTVPVEAPIETVRKGPVFSEHQVDLLNFQLIFSNIDHFELGAEEIFTMMLSSKFKASEVVFEGINYLKLRGEHMTVQLRQSPSPTKKLGMRREWWIGPLRLWRSYKFLANKKGN